jgi:hypothetical protein
MTADDNAGSAYVFVPGGFGIGSVSVAEGNAGTSVASVVVTLSAPYPITTSVEVDTEAGSATPYGDFQPVHKTISFAPGQTAKTVSVTIFGDTTIEPDEVFGMTLSHSKGAPRDDGSGTVTVLDDDLITVSIANGATLEKDSGTKNLTIHLTLSDPSTVSTSVKV